MPYKPKWVDLLIICDSHNLWDDVLVCDKLFQAGFNFMTKDCKTCALEFLIATAYQINLDEFGNFWLSIVFSHNSSGMIIPIIAELCKWFNPNWYFLIKLWVEVVSILIEKLCDEILISAFCEMIEVPLGSEDHFQKQVEFWSEEMSYLGLEQFF